MVWRRDFIQLFLERDLPQWGLTDLNLKHLTVIYPGAKRYALADKVTVVPLHALSEGGLRALTGG